MWPYELDAIYFSLFIWSSAAKSLTLCSDVRLYSLLRWSIYVKTSSGIRLLYWLIKETSAFWNYKLNKQFAGCKHSVFRLPYNIYWPKICVKSLELCPYTNLRHWIPSLTLCLPYLRINNISASLNLRRPLRRILNTVIKCKIKCHLLYAFLNQAPKKFSNRVIL